jgi:L-threonylcarbamoyladenylate synthase
VVLIEDGSQDFIKQVCLEQLKDGTVRFVGRTPVAIDVAGFRSIRIEGTASDYARSIYALLRQLDKENLNVVVIEGISELGEGAAVMDRLRRAAWRVLAAPK